MMIRLAIDGKKIGVKESTTVLDAARKLGIYVPTLCYHSIIKPYGSCRLCLVEAVENDHRRLVASCIHPVSEGLKVYTNTEDVLKSRKMTLELLLARCPNSEILKRLASQFGVKKVRFESRDDDCILCGLCVRACEEIVGIGAISFAHRGDKKKIGPPFERAASICIGCGTCAYVCPTGAIKLTDIVDTSTQHYWESPFKQVKCRICGDYNLESAFNSDLLRHDE